LSRGRRFVRARRDGRRLGQLEERLAQPLRIRRVVVDAEEETWLDGQPLPGDTIVDLLIVDTGIRRSPGQ
jgi:hypothetical protein